MVLEENYLFTIKPNFSTLGINLESETDFTTRGSPSAFMSNDSILGFDSVVIHEEFNLSTEPVDKLTVDHFFFLKLIFLRQ